MPGSLLVRTRGALNKKEVSKLVKRQRARKSLPEKYNTGILPSSDRHIMPALPSGRPSASLLLVALGGRSLAGAGIQGRSFIFPGSGGLASLGQSVQEFLANFSRQGSNVLENLRVLIG
jgi:hypothetical protein